MQDLVQPDFGQLWLHVIGAHASLPRSARPDDAAAAASTVTMSSLIRRLIEGPSYPVVARVSGPRCRILRPRAGGYMKFWNLGSFSTDSIASRTDRGEAPRRNGSLDTPPT